ncbi:hypothetical protein [Streptomyces sp. cg36]|uniref:hypothetical protein n=1 Tax=Streptomyces sp. cg36 TaxID=3238798 RepID=UPI0034E1B45B
MTVTTLPEPAMILEPNLANVAATLREKFDGGKRMVIGDSDVVHDVELRPWGIGSEQVPQPACHVGIGWNPLRLHATWTSATCGSCLRVRSTGGVLLLPGLAVQPPLWVPEPRQEALFA